MRRPPCRPSTTRSPTPTNSAKQSAASPMRRAPIEDPTSIYPVLGSISSALASLSQSLHQLGDFHDGPARKQAWMNGDPHAGRAASYKVSWELHRAAEMVHQVAECVDRAHEVEATIAYDIARLPVARAGPPAARRIAGCRCDRVAGRPTPFGGTRLARARAAAGTASSARPPPEPGCRRTAKPGVPRRSGRPTHSPPRSASTVTLPRAGEPGPAALRTPGRFRLPRHQDTSATLAGAYPFLAEGGLGSEGVFVGQDLYSGSSFVYDPWILYARGLITAPNLVLAGIVGSGKSCLAKSLYTRSIPFGRRVYVPGDPKGEHTAVAEAVGGRAIALGPRHAEPPQPARRGPPPLRARRRPVGRPDRLPPPRPRRRARRDRPRPPPHPARAHRRRHRHRPTPSAAPTYPCSPWSSTDSSPRTRPTIPTAGSPRTGASSATPCVASSPATWPGSSTDPSTVRVRPDACR